MATFNLINKNYLKKSSFRLLKSQINILKYIFAYTVKLRNYILYMSNYHHTTLFPQTQKLFTR